MSGGPLVLIRCAGLPPVISTVLSGRRNSSFAGGPTAWKTASKNAWAIAEGMRKTGGGEEGVIKDLSVLLRNEFTCCPPFMQSGFNLATPLISFMKNDDLPPRWREKLAWWIQNNTDGKHPTLGAGDFPPGSSLNLTFEDGSTAMFKYALLIEAPEFREIGVFTEHCGYHIFHADAVEYTLSQVSSAAQ